MTGPSLGQRPSNPVSQTHRDGTDEKYRDLRRPRKVQFYCNGDRYFKGKKLYITPHRYLTFNDLLNDLTGKLPANLHLPYGVRQIYSPVGGTRIRDIEHLGDGQTYVAAGFETFKAIKYGKSLVEPWSHAKPKKSGNAVYRSLQGRAHNHEFYSEFGFTNTGSKVGGYYGAFQPGKTIRQSYPVGRTRLPGPFGARAAAGSYWNQPNTEPKNVKPRVVTIVRHGSEPRSNVKLLLNRRSIQTYEQTMKDISEAFGPKWKNNRVKKLFSLKGKEIKGISDFFREDNVFIGVGNETLTAGDIKDILTEFSPENQAAKDLVKELGGKKRRDRPGMLVQNRDRELDQEAKDDATTGSSKRDSGFGSDSSNRDETERDEVIYEGRRSRYFKLRKDPGHEETLSSRIESERQRAAEMNREKACKKMKKRLVAEQRTLEEDRRRKGLLPLRPINEQDPFRKLQEDKEKEKVKQRKKEVAEQRLREAEERAQKEKVAQQEAEAQRAAQEESKVIVIVQDKDKALKTPRPHRSPRPSHRSSEEGYESDVDRAQSKPSPQVALLLPQLDDVHESKETVNSAQKSKKSSLSSTKHMEEEDTHARPKDSRRSNKRDKANDNAAANILPPIDTTKNKMALSNALDQNENDKVGDTDKDSKRDKEKEGKQTNKQRPTPQSQSQPKSKLERQISNATHVVERYEPGKLLGDGNFAVVKQCKLRSAPAGTPDYAMKVIDKSKLKGKEHMIENEIEIMRLCDHPTIVKLIDEFETCDEIYLIMELVKGGDLFDAITQSVKFTERVSAGMVSDLANALFYLHSRHVVHRDLKPENLLVCRNRNGTITLKLADFGLAMEVTDPIFTVCGTPTYVAPEILSEIGYGLEVDMWAVGVITYILLCGFPPFRSPDRNQTELFEFIKAGEFDYLSPYWDKISKDAKDLITRLLVVNKAKRYTAVEALCHPWLVSLGNSLPPPLPNMDDHRRNLRRDLDIQAKANRESFVNSRKS